MYRELLVDGGRARCTRPTSRRIVGWARHAPVRLDGQERSCQRDRLGQAPTRVEQTLGPVASRPSRPPTRNRLGFSDPSTLFSGPSVLPSLASIDCTSNRLRWSRLFHPFHHVRLKRSRRGGHLFRPQVRQTERCLIQSDFAYTSPSPSFLRPVCFSAAAPYPVGKGSAAIRRTMLSNSRRVRRLSASSSQ
jgi:hypothetical protein